jgi:hypothetical protein
MGTFCRPVENTASKAKIGRWPLITYRWDWQFAGDVGKIPFVQEAALLISITPILVFLSSAAFPQVSATVNTAFPLWMLWIAAMAFIFGRFLYYFFCPKFIQEYRDFGQYAARQHSHRWIIWEFYHNLTSLSGWREIVKETSPKGLTVDVTDLSGNIAERLTAVFGEIVTEDLKVFTPVNIERDIYLPIYAQGKRLVVPMREADRDLSKKEKELFWILYTQAAKERSGLRVAYWILIGLAVGFVLLTALTKIYLIFHSIKP